MRKYLINIIVRYASSLIILFICVFKITNGQDFIIDQFKVQDGLSQNQPWAIAQDSSGFLWIGTRKGLNRFDGQNFIKYYNNSNTAIYDNIVVDIEIDNLNRIWVASEFGFYGLFIGLNGKINRDFGPYLIDKQMFDLDIFGNQLFVCTDNGLFQYKLTLNGIELINQYLGENPEEITLFIEQIDTDSYLISTTLDKYYLLENNIINEIKSNVQNGFDLVVDSNNTPIIATLNGLASLDSNYVIEKLELKQNFPIPFRIIKDQKEGFWVGTYMDGLFYLNDNLSIDKHFANSIPLYITSIFQDLNGAIWVATDGSGVYRIRQSQFVKYNNNDGLSDNMIWSLKANPISDEIFVSTYKNFAWINDEIIIESPFAEEFENNSINCMEFSNEGQLYIGSEYGLYSLTKDRKKLLQIQEDGIIQNNSILSLKFEDNNNLWIGTDSEPNLLNFKNGNWDSFIYSSEDKKNRIRKIDFNSNDELWFITDQKLVFKDGIFWREFEFNGENIYDFSIINDSLIFVGSGSGLWELRNFKTQRVDVNLPEMTTIYSVKYNLENILWLGTDNGIYKYRLDNKNIVHFGISSGLTELETNSRTLEIDKNNNLWVGTTNGVFKKVNNKKINYIQTECFISEIALNDSILNANSKNEYSGHLDNLSFKFSSINLNQDSPPKYRWKLNGYNEKWHESTNDHLVFNNLNPGYYELEFQSIWSNNEKSNIQTFEFSIYMNFFESSTFQLIFFVFYFIVAISIIIFFGRIFNKKAIPVEVNLFKPNLEIILFGKNCGTKVFHSEIARELFTIILLKNIIDNSELDSDEIDQIIWPKIEKNKIENRKNVTIFKIRNLFTKSGIEDFIQKINNKYKINNLYSKFKCDLKIFIQNFEKGKLSEKANNKLDAIQYYKNCLKVYNINGIYNPQDLDFINKRNKQILSNAKHAADFIFKNKSINESSKIISKAQDILEN